MDATTTRNFEPIVVLAKLIAEDTDPEGYTTYVFKCLEKDVQALSRYIMCVRYPNWQHRKVKLNEIGYLEFTEVTAGIDEWFDGEAMVKYRYDAVQFIKFVEKPQKEDKKYIM